MDCFTLNERMHHNIAQYMEHKKGHMEERDTTPKFISGVYRPTTLINNWYEDRCEEHPESLTEPMITEFMDNYRMPCKTIYPDRKDAMKGFFDEFGIGQELIADHHGQSYYNNFVTTYDLAFNHLTKGICGPFPRKFRRGTGQYEPDVDYTRIYGNLTEFGLKKALEEEMSKLPTNDPPISEYTDRYINMGISATKRFIVPKWKRC